MITMFSHFMVQIIKIEKCAALQEYTKIYQINQKVKLWLNTDKQWV